MSEVWANLARVHLDFTHVPAGAVGGPEGQAQGRSWGGHGTRLHVLNDTAGRVLRVHLTSGRASDAPQAEPLLAGLHPDHVPADRAYASDDLRRVIMEPGAAPVIPGCRNYQVPIDHDRVL